MNVEGVKYLNFEVDARYKLKDGDLLFAITDITRNAEVVGAPVQVEEKIMGNPYFSMDLVRLDNIRNVENDFLFFALQQRNLRRFMRSRAHGSTVLHLDVRGAKKGSFLIPPNIDEQNKVVTAIKVNAKQLEFLMDQLEKLQHEKKSLIQQLLTGKRRVSI